MEFINSDYHVMWLIIAIVSTLLLISAGITLFTRYKCKILLAVFLFIAAFTIPAIAVIASSVSKTEWTRGKTVEL